MNDLLECLNGISNDPSFEVLVGLSQAIRHRLNLELLSVKNGLFVGSQHLVQLNCKHPLFGFGFEQVKHNCLQVIRVARSRHPGSFLAEQSSLVEALTLETHVIDVNHSVEVSRAQHSCPDGKQLRLLIPIVVIDGFSHVIDVLWRYYLSKRPLFVVEGIHVGRLLVGPGVNIAYFELPIRVHKDVFRLNFSHPVGRKGIFGTGKGPQEIPQLSLAEELATVLSLPDYARKLIRIVRVRVLYLDTRTVRVPDSEQKPKSSQYQLSLGKNKQSSLSPFRPIYARYAQNSCSSLRTLKLAWMYLRSS